MTLTPLMTKAELEAIWPQLDRAIAPEDVFDFDAFTSLLWQYWQWKEHESRKEELSESETVGIAIAYGFELGIKLAELRRNGRP